MRVSRERAAEHHEQIVATASRLYRRHGFDGVGLDAIMRECGLTHGGFYRHFRSKDDLAAEALGQALDAGEARQQRLGSLADVLGRYLSARHRADRSDGCAFAALGTDMPRQPDQVRTAFTARLRTRLRHFTTLVRGETEAARRQRAIATLSAMVGALTLARAVNDAALSDEIMTATRDLLLRDASDPA